MSRTHYLLDNRELEAAQRFAALSALFDPVSLRHFDACGLRAGWQCWEVGAGGAKLVRTLAGRVGESGRVLATDIDTSWAREAFAANIEVRNHDVALDPLPGGVFDLIHARLVLVHIPQRERAFQNMIEALRPGGWLVVEDADPALQPLSCIDARGPEEELANKIRSGFRTLLSQRGADLSFGRKLPRMFRAAQLEEVAGDAYFPVALPTCAPLENFVVTREEIERHLNNVRNGLLDLAQPPLISVRGRKPV